MQPSDFYLELQRVIPNENIPQIVAALRKDPLTWNSLGEERVLQKLNEKAQVRPDVFTPADIALIELGEAGFAADLSIDPMMAPEAGLKQRALQTYEETLRSHKEPQTLSEAGLLAIALRERRRITRSWDGTFQEIGDGEKSISQKAARIWRSPLACLFGMAPDVEQMLVGLLEHGASQVVMQLISHVLLTNSTTVEDTALIFVRILLGLGTPEQIEWLRQLKLQGHGDLVARIAQILVNSVQPASEEEHGDQSGLNSEVMAEVAKTAQYKASFYCFANQTEKASQQFRVAENVLGKWLSGLQLQSFHAANSDQELDQSLAGYAGPMKTLPGAAAWQTDLALSFGDRPAAKGILAGTAEIQPNPFVQIKRAHWMAEKGDLNGACTAAKAAVTELAANSDLEADRYIPKAMFDWKPVTFVQTLVDLDLLNEALGLAHILMGARSSDASLVEITSQIYQKLGDIAQSVQYARLRLMLEPISPDGHRRMAELWEVNNKWEKSFDERNQVLQLADQPEISDWLAYVQSALQANQPEQAMDVCSRILDNDPNHNLANVLMGQALMKQSEYAEAIQYLSKATLLVPEDPNPWLLLAEAYRETNEQQRSLETLRAAVLAVSDSAEINFALAETCLDLGSLSEALPFLRKAAQLRPGSLEVTLKLGRALFLLGYLQEACQVYEQARNNWPNNSELAYAFAEVLIGVGELEKALPLMEVALRAPAPRPEWYVLYAETMIGQGKWLHDNAAIDYARLVNAQQALDKAILLLPAHFRAQLLLAEVYNIKGSYLEASSLYQELVDYPEAGLPDWRWRVQGGLGKASLMIGEVETALASLQDAVLARPQNLYLQRYLAEAYSKASLKQEAMQTARFALRLAPDDLEHLTWFANLAIRFTAWEEAIEALRTATQLASDHSDLWVKLASIQLQAGDLELARQSLQTLLDLPQVTVDQLRQAAYSYMRMTERDHALDCLNRAIASSNQPQSELMFEAACLMAQTGNVSGALEVLQKTAEITPNSACLYVFQSDLLAYGGKYQAAVASVEHALQIINNNHETNTCGALNISLVGSVLPTQWMCSLENLPDLYIRMACWLRSSGDLNLSLQYTQKALDLVPESLGFRVFLANLHLSLMEQEKAAAVLVLPHMNEITVEEMGNGQQILWAEFVGLQVEIAFANDLDLQTSLILIEKLSAIVSSPRLLAQYARLMVRRGEWQQARDLLFHSMNVYQDVIKESEIVSLPLAGINLIKECRQGMELSLAEAAIEVRQWSEAIHLVEAYASRHANEPRAQFELGRKLVICAEMYRFYSELRSEVRAPQAEVVSDARFEQFEKAIANAERLCRSTELAHWKARGRVVFRPAPQHIRGLVNSLVKPDDTGALVLALRQMRNCALAAQIAQDQADDPVVAIQLALCLQEIEPQKGLEIALKLNEGRPVDPLYQISLAQVAEKVDEMQIAFDAVERALVIWNDEPEWHSWAAQLAGQLHKKRFTLSHLESAVSLRPMRTPYVIALGRAYIEQDQPYKALDLLGNASQQDSDQADIWLTMSGAYHQVGSLKESLECAEMAAKLETASASPILACGEIALDMGKNELAVEYALESMKREPMEIGPVLFASKVLTRQGKLKEALRNIERYLADRHNSLPVLYERAKLVHQLEGPMAALPYLEQLVEMDPGNAAALSNLAQAQAACADYKSAEKSIHAALTIEPDQYSLNLLMGRIKHKAGQLDQAIHYLSEAIRQAPAEMDAYLELADTYQERRETTQALRTYQQAISVAPNDHRPYYSAGLLMRETKDYVGAEAMLRKATKLAPSDVNIRKQLGAIIALNLVNNSQEVNSYS